MSRRRRGFNDRRAIKPAEIFLEKVEEGDLGKRALKEAIEGLGWEITHRPTEGGLACTKELEWIWKADKAALVRAIETYERRWGPASQRQQAGVIKGLGAFWVKYPYADIDLLVKSLSKDKVTVEDLYGAGRNQYQVLTFIKNVHGGVRYVLTQGYNKYRNQHQRSAKKLPISE